MGDVININCITRLDIDPEQVLESAKGNLESCVILGYDKEGNEYFASSLADGGDVNWLLDRCKLKLLSVVDEE